MPGHVFPDGHYWVRHLDGSLFITLRQHHRWYCCGVEKPIDLDVTQILGAVQEPHDA